MPSATLRIEGEVFDRWTDVRVTRSIGSVASAFTLSLVRERGTDLPVLPAGACTLFLEDTPVLAGYVDAITERYDSRSHGFTAIGRGRTCDLVDCSAIYKTGQWRDVPLVRIAGNLCEPFGIEVITTAQAAAEPIERHAIEPGETAAECIAKLVRKLGLLMYDDAQGRLVIERAAAPGPTTAIELSRNVKSGEITVDYRERFSLYRAVSQSASRDDFFGEEPNEGEGEAEDQRVPRYRPHVFVPDGHARAQDLTTAAEWRRNVYAARSQKLRYVVPLWTNATGDLWEPNTIAHVRDEILGIDRQMLVESCSYATSVQGGSVTELTLVHPDALRSLEGPGQALPGEGPIAW